MLKVLTFLGPFCSHFRLTNTRIQAYLPGVHVIREIDGMAADENHKWGLAPMHYQKEYYDRVLGRIYEITGITP